MAGRGTGPQGIHCEAQRWVWEDDSAECFQACAGWQWDIGEAVWM